MKNSAAGTFSSLTDSFPVKRFEQGTGNIYAAVSCLGNLYVCDIPDCGMWTSQRFRTFRLQVRHL